MKINQHIKIAVDAIVFGYQDNTLYVLLIKQRYGQLKNKWALPGGFVKDEEKLTQAVHRELKEETGVQLRYLEQLYTFGDDLKRDPRGRVISVAYFGTVNPKSIDVTASSDAKEAQWYSVAELPKLAFDHKKIIDQALRRLKAKLNYQPIGFELLRDRFVFSDLENLYRTILGRKIDRRNFRKKILSFGFLEETKEMSKTRNGRPAKLFRFNTQIYRQLVKEGITFEIKFA